MPLRGKRWNQWSDTQLLERTRSVHQDAHGKESRDQPVPGDKRHAGRRVDAQREFARVQKENKFIESPNRSDTWSAGSLRAVTSGGVALRREGEGEGLSFCFTPLPTGWVVFPGKHASLFQGDRIQNSRYREGREKGLGWGPGWEGALAL